MSEDAIAIILQLAESTDAIVAVLNDIRDVLIVGFGLLVAFQIWRIWISVKGSRNPW